MKLVRFGQRGQEKPGLVDGAGRRSAICRHTSPTSRATLSPASLAKLRPSIPIRFRWRLKGVRLGAPGRPRMELHRRRPQLRPTTRRKPARRSRPSRSCSTSSPTASSGPNDDVMIPRNSHKLDYEVEIAFVIGTPCALRRGEGCCPLHRRLLHLQRCVGAPFPGRAQRPVDEGQVLRDRSVRSARGSSRATRSRMCTSSPCRSTSTASGGRPARPPDMIFGIATTSCTTSRSSWCWSRATW